MGQRNHYKNHKKRKRNNRLLTTLAFLFLAVFIFSTVMFFKEYIQAKREQTAFTELSALITNDEIPTLPVIEIEQAEAAQKNTEKPEQKGTPHYEALYELNSDFIGWLNVPGTSIDYPVMFTPDEPEYYLRRSFDKTNCQSGTPFIGANGTTDTDCLIIYGHNMKNDTMFGTLDNYADMDFWTENKTFSFNTLSEYRDYEVFAAVKTNILYADETGFRYYNCSGDLTETEYADLIEWLTENALYDTEICPSYGEQILILSTCSYHSDNGRFIVAARRLN